MKLLLLSAIILTSGYAVNAIFLFPFSKTISFGINLQSPSDQSATTLFSKKLSFDFGVSANTLDGQQQTQSPPPDTDVVENKQNNNIQSKAIATDNDNNDDTQSKVPVNVPQIQSTPRRYAQAPSRVPVRVARIQYVPEYYTIIKRVPVVTRKVVAVPVNYPPTYYRRVVPQKKSYYVRQSPRVVYAKSYQYGQRYQ